jgi:hypothetical protein
VLVDAHIDDAVSQRADAKVRPVTPSVCALTDIEFEMRPPGGSTSLLR